MSEAPTPVPVHWRRVAEEVCTTLELDALVLHIDHGMGYERVGLVLGISRSAARDRIRNGARKMNAHVDEQ